MRDRRFRLIAASAVSVAIAALIAGCAVGPDYRQPPIQVDPTFVSAGASGVNQADPGADLASFWRGFGDPALSDLVERAIAANGDVKVAQGRLQEARALLLGADANLLPEVDVNGDVIRARQPAYLYPGTSNSQRTATVYDASFVANWELDFFGRLRRASESASAQVDATEAGVHAAQTAVIGDVASYYLQLRGFQQRYEVAKRSLENQNDTVRITRATLDAGRSTQFDVARAQSLYDSTEATLPALQTQIEQAAYRLATLTAQQPRELLTALSTPQALPSLPVTDLGALPLGTPEQLLRRRPDLVSAERQLASATADIGVATADLFPRISLQGYIGFASTQASQFGKSNSQEYSGGAFITWPFLDFGRVRSRIRASEARQFQALATYEQTVRTALEETEGALSQFTRTQQQAERLQSAARNADDAARIARLRYEAGSTALLDVLDAERQALSSHDALVQAQVGQEVALVTVYRSLGGGWR